MKNTFFILSNIFLISVLSAQSPDLRPNLSGALNDHNLIRDYANNWTNNINKTTEIEDLKNNVKGSPYYDDKFYRAILNGSFPVPQKLRYNAYSDQMEFMNGIVTYEINKIEGLELYFPEVDITYATAQIIENNKSNLVYLKQIESGKYGLYERQRIMLKGGEGINNGLVNNTGYSFSKQKSMYYIRKDNVYTPIPNKVSEFKAQYPEIADKIISKNNLSNLNDLKNIVNSLNK